MNSLDYTHLHEMRFSFSFRFTFQLETSADRFWIWINHEPARSKDFHTPDSSSTSFVRSNVFSTFFVRPQRLDQSCFFNVSGSLIPSFWISDIGSRMLIYFKNLVFPPRESWDEILIKFRRLYSLMFFIDCPFECSTASWNLITRFRSVSSMWETAIAADVTLTS